MFTLGNSTFTVERVVKFFNALRDVGMEGKYQLPRLEHVRQYVICGVFSHDEIESGDEGTSQIQTLYDRLADERRDENFHRKFISDDRLVVLLNNLGRHGETRLFDPDRAILRELGVVGEDDRNDVVERYNYLDSMKRQFIREFGEDKQQYIVLLSHLIPCTEEGHMCSRLLRQYADNTKSFLIVSYDSKYSGTDSSLALTNMTHDNIHFVKPRERREAVNKDIRDMSQEDDLETEASCMYENDHLTEDPDMDENSHVSKRQKIREKRKYSPYSAGKRNKKTP